MDSVGLFILMTLTAFRVTWFVTKDDFPPMRAIREWSAARHAHNSRKAVRPDPDEHPDDVRFYEVRRGPWEWLFTLVTCFWCVSVYVSAALTIGVTLVVDLNVPWLWFGALTASSALVSQVTDATIRLTNSAEE